MYFLLILSFDSTKGHLVQYDSLRDTDADISKLARFISVSTTGDVWHGEPPDFLVFSL